MEAVQAFEILTRDFEYLSAKGRRDAMLKLLEMLPERAQRITIRSYPRVINAYAKVGHWEYLYSVLIVTKEEIQKYLKEFREVEVSIEEIEELLSEQGIESVKLERDEGEYECYFVLPRHFGIRNYIVKKLWSEEKNKEI